MRLFGKSKGEEQTKKVPDESKGLTPRPLNKEKKDSFVKTNKHREELSSSEESQTSQSLFNRFQKKSEQRPQKILNSESTIIGKTIVIKGEITGGEEVVVEGKVEGDIFILNKLIVGLAGVVAGHVKAQDVKISGKIKGEIKATNKVELTSTGDVVGELSAPRIVVSEGASIDGNVQTGSPNKPSVKPSLKNESSKKEASENYKVANTGKVPKRANVAPKNSSIEKKDETTDVKKLRDQNSKSRGGLQQKKGSF